MYLSIVEVADGAEVVAIVAKGVKNVATRDLQVDRNKRRQPREAFIYGIAPIVKIAGSKMFMSTTAP